MTAARSFALSFLLSYFECINLEKACTSTQPSASKLSDMLGCFWQHTISIGGSGPNSDAHLGTSRYSTAHDRTPPSYQLRHRFIATIAALCE